MLFSFASSFLLRNRNSITFDIGKKYVANIIHLLIRQSIVYGISGNEIRTKKECERERDREWTSNEIPKRLTTDHKYLVGVVCEWLRSMLFVIELKSQSVSARTRSMFCCFLVAFEHLIFVRFDFHSFSFPPIFHQTVFVVRIICWIQIFPITRYFVTLNDTIFSDSSFIYFFVRIASIILNKSTDWK